MSGGVEKYRRPLLNRVQRGIAGGQTNILPVDNEKISAQVSTFVHVKDRLKVAIYEPVEVYDDDVVFGRQWIDNMERIFVNEHRLCIDPSIACVHCLCSSLA